MFLPILFIFYITALSTLNFSRGKISAGLFLATLGANLHNGNTRNLSSKYHTAPTTAHIRLMALAKNPSSG